MSRKKLNLIDMTALNALKPYMDKAGEFIEQKMQERSKQENTQRQSNAGQGNKEKQRRLTEILEEVIETDNPTKFKKLLKLLDAHEYIDDVDYDRKTVIYIKKDGGLSSAVSFAYLEKYFNLKNN